MDALSETLRLVRLLGALFVDARFAAPWCYQAASAEAAAPLLDPAANSVVIFYLVGDGECYVQMGDAAAVCLRAGDAAVLPLGPAHRVGSQPGLPPVNCAPLETLLARPPRRPAGGDGDGGGVGHDAGACATRLACGYLACDTRLARMLLAGLPPLVRVNVRGSEAGAWLDASVRYAVGEARSTRPGCAGVLTKLAEALLIDVLRLYMNEHGDALKGWLAGIGDRVVGAALNALHKRPAHAWTLEELAREAGTSRSVLAERFQHLVGSSPMQYLTQWRMMLAANLLCGSDAPLARIAEDVGYQTDTAFSRAFRREFGAPPAAWRRTQALRTPSR